MTAMLLAEARSATAGKLLEYVLESIRDEAHRLESAQSALIAAGMRSAAHPEVVAAHNAMVAAAAIFESLLVAGREAVAAKRKPAEYVLKLADLIRNAVIQDIVRFQPAPAKAASPDEAAE